MEGETREHLTFNPSFSKWVKTAFHSFFFLLPNISWLTSNGEKKNWCRDFPWVWTPGPVRGTPVTGRGGLGTQQTINRWSVWHNMLWGTQIKMSGHFTETGEKSVIVMRRYNVTKFPFIYCLDRHPIELNRAQNKCEFWKLMEWPSALMLK